MGQTCFSVFILMCISNYMFSQKCNSDFILEDGMDLMEVELDYYYGEHLNDYYELNYIGPEKTIINLGGSDISTFEKNKYLGSSYLPEGYEDKELDCIEICVLDDFETTRRIEERTHIKMIENFYYAYPVVVKNNCEFKIVVGSNRGILLNLEVEIYPGVWKAFNKNVVDCFNGFRFLYLPTDYIMVLKAIKFSGGKEVRMRYCIGDVLSEMFLGNISEIDLRRLKRN